MRIPWRREQLPEEQPPLQPSEHQVSSSRWQTTKGALQAYVKTAQAEAASTKDTLQDHLRINAYQFPSRPASYLVLSGFVLGSVSTLGATFVYRRCFRRLRMSEWVTPDILGRRRWVKGIVTR
jgi:hypothetical protein